MNALGITHPISLNSAACLIQDGKITSINEEERFNRIKHGRGSDHEGGVFPQNAVKECLKVGKIEPSEVDVVAVGWNPETELQRQSDRAGYLKPHTDLIFSGLSELGIPKDRIRFYNHHISHLASSFFCSDFAFGNLLSLDGAGDDCAGWVGFSEGAFSNYQDINTHQSTDAFSEMIEVDYSWGAMWEDITEMLGFQRHSAEGKTMGLAPYGKYDLDVFPELFRENGSPDLYKYYCFWAEKGWLREAGKQIEPLSDTGKNVAYMLQYHYNNYLAKKAEQMVKHNGCKNFSLSGGCALNCSGNGHLARLDFVDDIFVQPASGDNGTAIGAAILGCQEHGGNFENNFDHAYWGSEFSQDEIKEELDKQGLIYSEHYHGPSSLVAELLTQDKVVCNFQGRAEIGPRALGNRSILANPCGKGTLDKVNKIKGREPWRPLAPSILEEDYFDVVESKVHSPYMLMACQVKEDYKEKIPAVVHVDGSCRPQTVYKKTNPIFHDIILEFKKRTGIPLVLNTSFNLSYEPIVNSPYDAIRTFIESDADALCIGNFIVEK